MKSFAVGLLLSDGGLKFQISNLRFQMGACHWKSGLAKWCGKGTEYQALSETNSKLMTYQRFEDLPVWQKASELYELTEELLGNESFSASRGFRDQLDRAASSVSNNIAEGFERGTKNELLAFIYIARGSAGEVRSMLTLKQRRAGKAGWPQDLNSQISNLKLIAESCSRQLRAWADSLQNSNIKGQRYLTDKSRADDEKKKQAAAFEKDLVRNLPAWHPKRKEAEEKG